jgi:hypothetical protein
VFTMTLMLNINRGSTGKGETAKRSLLLVLFCGHLARVYGSPRIQ